MFDKFKSSNKEDINLPSVVRHRLNSRLTHVLENHMKQLAPRQLTTFFSASAFSEAVTVAAIKKKKRR